MRLELAERLRCPRPHAPTPLVVVASQVVERDLRRGEAGCPVCRYEARIVDGDLVDGGPRTPADARPRAAASPTASPTEARELERLVALLGLAEPGGAVLLTGGYAALANDLASRCDVAVITDSPRASRPLEDPVAAVLGFTEAMPFTDGTFRAAALAAGTPPALATDQVRCVATGGRVVAPASVDRPAGLRELARDAQEWVAETEARPRVVELKRRG